MFLFWGEFWGGGASSRIGILFLILFFVLHDDLDGALLRVALPVPTRRDDGVCDERSSSSVSPNEASVACKSEETERDVRIDDTLPILFIKLGIGLLPVDVDVVGVGDEATGPSVGTRPSDVLLVDVMYVTSVPGTRTSVRIVGLADCVASAPPCR